MFWRYYKVLQNGKRLFEFAGQYSTANQDIGLFLNSGRIPDFYGNTHSFGLKDVSGIKQYVHFKSNGFIEAVSVTDFPIRDHKVILEIRRKR